MVLNTKLVFCYSQKVTGVSVSVEYYFFLDTYCATKRKLY